jgi:hypothetical protein
VVGKSRGRLNNRREKVGDAALAGTVLVLVVCDEGKDANFIYSSPIFEMGGAQDALKVFLRRRVRPPIPGEPGAFIPDAIHGANVVLGLVQAGSLSGVVQLLVVWSISIS